MAEWREVYRDSFEGAWYDQDGATEVTIPEGHSVVWAADSPRPEMDRKDKETQPEVYDGRYAGVGFHRYTAFSWWLYSDPINVTAGLSTRAKVAVMILTKGIGDNPEAIGDAGMRLGIAPATADVSNVDNSEIVWSEWRSVRDTDADRGNQGAWAVLTTPSFVPQVGRVQLIIQCNANVAASISAGHYDLEIIEQYTDDQTPPPNPPPSGDGLQADMLAAIDSIQAELDSLRALVEGMSALAVQCIPIERV